METSASYPFDRAEEILAPVQVREHRAGDGAENHKRFRHRNRAPAIDADERREL